MGICCSASAAWWDTDWSHRIKITSQNAKVLVTESDYMYYYPMSELPADFWTNVKSDGGDVRVTEGDDTPIPFHVVDWDNTNDMAGLFFKGNSDSGTDQDFYIYYGNAGASALSTSDTYGQFNVYSGFRYVHHLDEGFLGGANSLANSAANADHGSPFGGSGTGDEVTGKLDFSAIDYDGQSDPRIVRMPSNSTTFKTLFPSTYLIWINADNYTDRFVLSSKYWSANSFRVYRWEIFTTMFFHKWTTSDDLHTYESVDDASLATDVWLHFAISMSSDALTVQGYENGQPLGATGSLTNTNVESTTSTNVFPLFGAMWRSSTTPDFVCDGSMQNHMIANTAWSDDKVETYYNNTDAPTTFWNTGVEEDEGAAPRRVIIIN